MSLTNKDYLKETSREVKETTPAKHLEQQKQQQVRDVKDNISESSDTINENINKFQTENKRILNVDSFRKFQEQITSSVQEISSNATGLQKNFFNIYQSSYTQFFNNLFRYWQNFNISERYFETYNIMNNNMQGSSFNIISFINEVTIGSLEHFSKSVELTQLYYNDLLKNNFNYAKKIERSYKR